MNTGPHNQQGADDAQAQPAPGNGPAKTTGKANSKTPPASALPGNMPQPPLPFNTNTPGQSQTLWPVGQRAPRVLVVSQSRIERDSTAARLIAHGMDVEPAASPAEAIAAIATDQFDLAIVQISIGDNRGIELLRNLRELDESLGFVLTARKANINDAVQAMQQGVLDLLVGKLDGADLCQRVEHAVGRARQRRHEHMRVERLKRICRDVNTSRDEMTHGVGSLCNDLATAYQELTEQMAHVGLATEFNSLIRQELDLECLLRTVLEFLLAKVGPTNAAIFLPSTSGDYSLGAYVNYDCPRDTAEVLLEHLAGVVPERFESETGVVMMRSEQALVAHLDDHADWLDGYAVACLSCVEDDECLAVLMLFRDRQTGFSQEHETLLGVIGDLFAKQLSRVIHIHHRHLPKDQWGEDQWSEETPHYPSEDDLWDEDADDHGMAA